MKYAAIILSVFALLPAVAGDAFKIDGGHSSVVFSVQHNGIADFYGRFNHVSGTITYDAGNPSASAFDITIDANSIDTNGEKRDKHLRGSDFFSSKQFPDITFKSTKVTAKGGTLHVTGDMTMLGKTNSVTLEVTVSDTKESRGATLRGFAASGSIKRSTFGMTYGVGGPLGDDVKLIISLEGSFK